MKTRSPSQRKLWITIAVGAGVLLLPLHSVNATLTVASGWDLLTTDPTSTTFAGASFAGVPIGTYDFGGTIGVKSVGMTDTIVQRQGDATVSSAPDSAAPIPIELVALQLRSVTPINLGAGVDFHYITLQSARGGPDSVGEMTVGFADSQGGLFTSFFDVFFDVRLGALDGPILASDHLQLANATGTPWSHDAPAGVLLIDGVNHRLNGTDTSADFWPDPILEEHPSGAKHGVRSAVPEPSTYLAGLILAGVMCSSLLAERRRRKLNTI